MVDVRRTCVHPCKGTLITQYDAAQIVVIANAGENNLCASRGFFGRRARATTELFHPGLRLLGISVVNSDLVPRHGQMSSHGQTHHP